MRVEEVGGLERAAVGGTAGKTGRSCIRDSHRIKRSQTWTKYWKAVLTL